MIAIKKILDIELFSGVNMIKVKILILNIDVRNVVFKKWKVLKLNHNIV